MKKAQGIMSGGSVGGAVILIVLLAFILIYIIAIPTEYRDELGLEEAATYSSLVLQEYPGSLSIGNTNDIAKETYTYDIGSVSLDNSPQKESTLLLPQGFLKKSTTSTKILEFPFNIDSLEDLDKVYLNFNVIEKEGSGNLIVKLNDVTIYSKQVKDSENVVVTLPMYQLRDTNTIKITTSSTGWKFWSTNSYLLSDIYLEEDKYNRLGASVSRRVILDKDQLYAAEEIKLIGYAKKLSSRAQQVTIDVNVNEIYSDSPSTSSIEAVIPTNYLKSGTNNFNFEVAKDGKYDLLYLYLQIKTVELSENNIAEYTFNIDTNQWSYIKSSKYKCNLYIEKSGGDNQVNIDLNNHILRYSFDDNNKIEKDICNYLQNGDNKITLSPEKDLYIKEVRLTIQNK